MKKLLNLYKKNEEIINYLIFGFLTTFIGLFVYFILTISILDPNNYIELQIANIISWICSVIFAYFTNRRYVFKSNNGKLKEGIKFFIARVFTLLLDMLIMGIGVSILKFNDRIIKIISQVVIIISNYLISKILVFKKEKL